MALIGLNRALQGAAAKRKPFNDASHRQPGTAMELPSHLSAQKHDITLRSFCSALETRKHGVHGGISVLVCT